MKTWLFLLLCNFLWAGNFISGKIAAGEFPPFWISLLRWSLAVIILLPLAFWAQKTNLKAIDRKTWLNLAAMGFFGVDLFTLFTYSALQYSTPVNVSLINTLTPAFAMLFAAVVLKIRTFPRQYFGLALAIFGVLTVITQGDLANILTIQFNKGDLLMLLGDMSWVLYTVTGKNVTTLPPITTTALSSLLGVIFLLPFAPFVPLPTEAITLAGVSSILYISLGASVCAFILWNIALQRVTITAASISMNLIPLYTVMLSLLFGESFQASQLVGGILVLGGICCISLPQRKAAVQSGASAPTRKSRLHPVRLLAFISRAIARTF